MLLLHWIGPHCTSLASPLCLPDFSDTEAPLQYAVCVCLCVCVFMWERQCTGNDGRSEPWFENYKAPAFSPLPPFSSFHPGNLGLGDPHVICVFTTLPTVFGAVIHCINHKNIKISLKFLRFYLKFLAEHNLIQSFILVVELSPPITCVFFHSVLCYEQRT